MHTRHTYDYPPARVNTPTSPYFFFFTQEPYITVLVHNRIHRRVFYTKVQQNNYYHTEVSINNIVMLRM